MALAVLLIAPAVFAAACCRAPIFNPGYCPATEPSFRTPCTVVADPPCQYRVAGGETTVCYCAGRTVWACSSGEPRMRPYLPSSCLFPLG
jgi:hypothetical protein